MSTKPYSFSNDCILLLNGIQITGFADGNDAIIFAPVQDRVNTRVGADGHATPAVNANRLWEMTVKLMDTAISNSIMQGFEQVQDLGLPVFPMLFKDAAGLDIFESTQCWLSKQAGPQYGQEANIREWGFQFNDANYIVGGHP